MTLRVGNSIWSIRWYSGHLGELLVTQISKYRDLTHVRETAQIKCRSTLAIYVLIHTPMLPTLNSNVIRSSFHKINPQKVILWHHYSWPLTLYPGAICILYVYVILLYHRYISMWSLSSMAVIETCARQS